jgi:hypothetical protein
VPAAPEHNPAAINARKRRQQPDATQSTAGSVDRGLAIADAEVACHNDPRSQGRLASLAAGARVVRAY